MKYLLTTIVMLTFLTNCHDRTVQKTVEVEFEQEIEKQIEQATEKIVESTLSIMNNPLFKPFNEPIPFADLTADHIEVAVEYIQDDVKSQIDQIIAIPEEERTFDNTLRSLDALYADYIAVAYPIYLMGYTHPDSSVRNTALEANSILDVFSNEIELNEDLYNAVKAYSLSKEAKNLEGFKEKFLKETVAGYERNGFALSPEDREQLKAINDELSLLSNEFQKNIATYQDFLIVSEEDIVGLPEDYKEARKQEDGTYKIDLSYPSYVPFMKYCESGEQRKKLSFKYSNRAYPENIEVLRKLLQKRLEKANLLGFDTYSDYRLDDKMAKTPETVWEFENNLIRDMKPKYEQEMDELLEVKKEHIGEADMVYGWEISYLDNILQNEKYQLDDEKVKQYFALDDVLDGLFHITQSLFDLEYKEVKNPSVWHEDVRMFEVYQDDKKKGIFYLDLHPRPNKYNHAACFGFMPGLLRDKGYQIPQAALVCNFPRGSAEAPALLPHTDVETFFHEFGHVLHHMVTTTELSSHSGTSVARDFVEAPSQIFENWVWDYDALKLFAKHHETGDTLPEELLEKMLKAKNAGMGRWTAGQVYLGVLDFTLHDKYDPTSDISTTDVLKDVRSKIIITPYEDSTHFHAAFGHLNGYGSSYYGYLWSLVYAQDMFSVFDENGILDKETGLRYRDIILAKGGSEEALELVKEFLGREPNNKAFLKELGL